jgi:transcriptional regulator with XRE-family HTH domain
LHRRKKLIFWRINNRLRQKDISDQLGITPAHYSNLERGLSDPSFEVLAKFKHAYGIVDVIDLFEKEHKPWPQ